MNLQAPSLSWQQDPFPALPMAQGVSDGHPRDTGGGSECEGEGMLAKQNLFTHWLHPVSGFKKARKEASHDAIS